MSQCDSQGGKDNRTLNSHVKTRYYLYIFLLHYYCLPCIDRWFPRFQEAVIFLMYLLQCYELICNKYKYCIISKHYEMSFKANEDVYLAANNNN